MEKTRINYKEYLTSVDWLLKKHELISLYLKQKWNIECFVCHKDKDLQVHHWDYNNVGNEKLSKKEGLDLSFLCRDCHKKWHFEKNFKEKWVEEGINEIINFLKTKKVRNKKIK